MTNLVGALEERLRQGYQQQLILYDQALVIVEERGPDWAHALGTILEKVTLLDATMTGDKTAWRGSAVQAGPELSVLLDQVKQRIARLAECIHCDITDLQARQQQLLPEIDDLIRRRRMLEAYGTYGDRPSHVA